MMVWHTKRHSRSSRRLNVKASFTDEIILLKERPHLQFQEDVHENWHNMHGTRLESLVMPRWRIDERLSGDSYVRKDISQTIFTSRYSPGLSGYRAGK